MIKYCLTNTLIPMKDTDPLSEKTAAAVEILTSSEYSQQHQDIDLYRLLNRGLSHIHYCKADVMGSFITGTFSIPSKEQTAEKISFGFYMTDMKLTFVDDLNFVASVLEKMKQFYKSDSISITHFLFSFMEYLVKDDVFFLQRFEGTLTKLEEQILDNRDDDYNHRILKIRRKLAALGAYYEQLQDMAEDLQQGTFAFKDEKNSRLFGLFADRSGRLYSNVQMLKEYSIQLREMHQTQVDIRQNQIMKFLTIVTTVFMPLTLIVGWYGMNFIHMPELTSPYGYAAICVLSVVIVLVEIWLFKKKHWFD